jgi:hypothetical protein
MRRETKDRTLYERISACDNKVPYRTREEAERLGLYQDVYRCRFCKLYHRSTPLVVKTMQVIKKVETAKQRHNRFYAAQRRGEI